MNKTHEPATKIDAVAVAFVVVAIVHVWVFLSEPSLKVDFDFPYKPSPYLVNIEGWTLDRSGLVADADQYCEIRLGLTRSRFEDIYLEVIPARNGHGKIDVRVSVSAEGETDAELVPEQGVDAPPWNFEFGRPHENIDATSLVPESGPVNLSAMWPDGGDFLVYVKPSTGASGPLVRSIHIHRRVWRWWSLLLPLFYGAMYFTFAYLRQIFVATQVDRVAICVAIALGVLAILLPIELMWIAGWLAVFALAICCVPALSNLDDRLPVALAVAVITLYAASLRLDALSVMRFQPLAVDAQNFRAIANHMSWFYDSDHREPGVIALVKLFLAVFGDGDFQVRLFSLFLSIALVPAAYFAGKEIRSPLTGVVFALLIATNSGWIWQATRGLRLEAFSLALLCLTACVLTKRKLSFQRHAVAMGICAGAVCLLRITSLWFCLLAIGYGLLRRGWNTKSMLIATAIVVLPLVPYWIYCASTFGDPMYAVNHHIKFYRNLEKQDQPGFPTADELETNPYAGEDITSVEFFFGTLSLADLADRSGKQFYSIFVGDHFFSRTCDGNRFLACWALASYFVVFFTRQRSLLPWMVVLIGPIAWLFGPTYGPEWRLIFHASLFVFLSMSVLADAVLSRGKTTVAQG